MGSLQIPNQFKGDRRHRDYEIPTRIVISTNELNKWGERYIFLPITSKKHNRVYPFEILINFQGKKGKALPDQIKTYSHSRIIKKLGVLDPKYYLEIENKLKEVFNF